MFQDAALDKCTIQLQSAFAAWRARLKQVGGLAISDDIVLELLHETAKAHLAAASAHGAAVAAHIEAESLPHNVVSLDQRRAQAMGQGKAQTLGSAPFGQVMLGDAAAAERLNRLAHRTGKDRDALLTEAVRRGLHSLEKEAGPDGL